METVSNSATPAAAGSPAAIDADTCFRAYETRDERFDGRFFVAVKTTGIFCRPAAQAGPEATSIDRRQGARHAALVLQRRVRRWSRAP